MKRALILGDLPGLGVEALRRCCEVVVRTDGLQAEAELAELIPGFHGVLTLLTQPVGQSVFAAADNLEIVANYAVGVDNIDLGAAERRGVIVTNTPDVLTDDTADLTWALILAVLRGVVSGDRFLRRGEFDGWTPKLLLGRSLQSVEVGVIGAGRIGRAVLERARAFGVATCYTSRTRLPEAAERQLSTRWVGLEALVSRCEVVSLHTSLNAETHHLLDAKRLRSMRQGSYLINTARGPLVDEKALVEVLREGHLAGAGLDVFEYEPAVEQGLLELENVVLLPHLGSATLETRTRMADCCFEDLEAVLCRGTVPSRAVVPRSES